jgi:2-C-methyl-D-erythritol 2,4-cyclodiphosphate synthase
MIRSGIGYDTHRLVVGRKLILGGVEIPHERGLEGHSDADVLSHAIADALLGAIGEGDIGQHFPNTDESIRDISSLEILRHVRSLLAEKNARAINIDATVITEAPTLQPYFQEMRTKIAGVLACDISRINVKATTNEGLGTIGRGEGMAALATVLVEDL